MKVQAPITSAIPAALAAASIALALVLLPGGGSPVRSAGLAPALKLVTGEVVSAVESPARAVSKAPRKSVVSHSTGVARAPEPTRPASSSSTARSAPAHHPRSMHHARTSATKPAPVKTVAAQAPKRASSLPAHGHGKGQAKALGHLRKVAPLPAPAVKAAAQSGPAKGHGVKAQGRPANVPHDPPTVPAGQAPIGQSAVAQGASNGRGSGR